MDATSNIVWHNAAVTRKRREAQNKHRGAIIWFTGLSGAGKSTLAHAVEEKLHQMGCRTFVLDGNNRIIIKRIEPTIDSELSTLQETLSEWNSPEDDEAWRNL